MLDSGVFEPVNPKAAKTFEDQGTKLFRFLPDPDSENSDSFHVSHEVIADKARCVPQNLCQFCKSPVFSTSKSCSR